MTYRFAALGLLFGLALLCSRSSAWVLPEHRHITEVAVARLSLDDRSALQKMWSLARAGHEARLAENVVGPLTGTTPTPRTSIDFADLPALAGDHSVSPADLAKSTLQQTWPLEVLGIGETLRVELLAAAGSSAAHGNALRRSDLRLQRADELYATRAGSNGAHFLLALDKVNTSFETFLHHSTQPKSEINAVGLYVYFHGFALEKARQGAASAAFYDEAFALHFLQDSFAAGHAAGNWGDTAQRKGTHDFFNERGLKTSTWEGKQIVLAGDAWLRPEDAALAAEPVRASLAQLVQAFSPAPASPAISPDDFDIASATLSPPLKNSPSLPSFPGQAMKQLPIPSLKDGVGSLPRFRSELGPFLGLSPSSRINGMSKGFANSQNSGSAVSGLEFSTRAGLGLDGVLNDSSDGLAFIELGFRLDSSSSQGFVNDPGTLSYGALASALPARSAYSFRLRAPFYLVPGDLLVLGPLLYLFAPQTAKTMAVVAVNGGLLPWQAGISTAIGRFQFVLGREVGVYLFGRGSLKDAFLLPRADSGAANTSAIVSYMSDQFEFPFLEYRPFHHYSESFTYNLLLQFFAGIDRPHSLKVISTTSGVTPAVRESVFFGGLRLVYDYRHYF